MTGWTEVEAAVRSSIEATPSSQDLVGFVTEAEARFGVPAAWIQKVMRAESNGLRRAVSPKGAMGLMQIMPATWSDLRQRYGLGADPFDPHDNIIAGAAYLRELYDQFGVEGFLAAYNAGPARYFSHVAYGRPLPLETQTYARSLALSLEGGAALGRKLSAANGRSWRTSRLFLVQSSERTGGVEMAAPGDTTGRVYNHLDGRRAALNPLSSGLFVTRAASVPRP
jgi:hypothetical protein